MLTGLPLCTFFVIGGVRRRSCPLCRKKCAVGIKNAFQEHWQRQNDLTQGKACDVRTILLTRRASVSRLRFMWRDPDSFVKIVTELVRTTTPPRRHAK